MFDERDRKYFYDEFKNNGYEVGSYDDFKNDLNNKEDRDWYYNEAKNMGYDVGTQSDFDKMVMEPSASASSDSKQVAASATPQSAGQSASAEGKQQVAQPVAKPAAEKPKEDNRSWLTKWMTGTLPEEEEQETADKEPGLIAKALNMFPTGVQTSNGTYQPAPAVPMPVVNENKEEQSQQPTDQQVDAMTGADPVRNVDAIYNKYVGKGDALSETMYDLMASGQAQNQEEAQSMAMGAVNRAANRLAQRTTDEFVSKLGDTVEGVDEAVMNGWHSHAVQDNLKKLASQYGIMNNVAVDENGRYITQTNGYDQFINGMVKPAMVESLVKKYGENYRKTAEDLATRLYSNDEVIQNQLMNQDINAALVDVIGKYVNPSVVEEYNEAQEAGSKAFNEGMEGSQFIPANLRLGTALGAQYEANEAKDPAKVLSGLQKKFGKLYRNPEFLNDMSNAAFKVMQRYGLNGTLGSDPKQFKPMINSVLKNELDQLEIKGMMPKGSAEYIMKTGLGNTIVGKITRKAVQTDYQNWLEDMANQQYHPGFWENVASGALTFAGDAWSYWLPGAAGGKLTKSMIAKAEGKLAGDLMAKGMERRVAERAAKVLIGKSKTEALKSGAAHGAVTFGGQSVISKPIDETYRTGQFDENGKIYNPSGWKIALDTLLEGTQQSALGVIMQGNTIANMLGKGRGLATNILADIGGKVADSGIMTGHQILERMAQDPNFKPTGKDAAESFLESMANLTAIGLPGMMGKYARFKDAREFNKKYDFTDQDIAELKRFGYEDLRDAFEKVGIGEYAVAGENAQRLDGQLTQKYMNLMNDKSVPEVLKAKMMAVVEGKRPSSFSPVIDSEVYRGDDGKYYLETYNKDGGVIDRKEYSSHDAARNDEKKMEYEKTLGLASVLEGEFHKEFTQEHLDGLYNKAAQKYNMGENLTDEDKAAVYLHQNAGAIKEIMYKQQKGVILTDEEQKQVNAYRHYYDSALETSSVMREFVNTFEDSHGVARGTLRKALESKDKKYAPLVESYLKELYNSIELKREMKQTMDDLYNTAHGNEQKRIESENPVSPVEGSAEGAAGGLEPPVSEGPAPYQDRTNSVSTPSDAEVAANPANVASSAAGGAGNETKVASSENKVASSDAFIMGQEAYKNGDSGALQAIDYNSDLATGRLKRAFKDSDNMFDLVVKVYNEGRDMEQFLAQRASHLTSAQKEAISKYVEAMDAKKGAIDALQHADDGYGEALKQQLWPYQTEDGNIVPATLTSGRQVFLKKANEYGGGFVVVPDEQGQPTIKQVSDAEIKEVGTPVPLDEYIESSLAQQKEARAQQFISQFDGSGLKPNDRVAVAMEEGDENIDMTFAGYSEDGKIVLTDGKDNIALTREEFAAWRTNALNNTINENLDREDGERELAEIKRAETEKQERYKKGIFGYAAGQPDYSDAQTDPKVAAEYLQETARDDRKALFANIVAEKQALQKRINQLREHIASNEEWLSINADLDPKNAETRTLANKQMEGQIADLQARFDNWNKIRSAVMTPEEAQAIKADRTQKIADAGVNEGDVAPIEGREVAVLSDEELKKQYPTMDEASDFIASERKRIYLIQSDEVQREIDGVDEVLDRYVNGEIDLEPEQIKELNTTKAQLQARQTNLTESAKELKAQADKLKTLYRKENMEARAKVLENLTPAEQRAIKVENAIKNGNMSQLNAIYDEVRGAIDFNDTEPNTLEEYVANSIGRFALNYEGKEKGGAFSNGIQQETGLGRKDFDKLQILAKEGEGKTVPEFVHGLYDDMPENLKQMGYTDQDIRSAFLELLGSAQSYLDIKNYTLNNKVANVEQQMREVERQEEEMMQDGVHSEAFDKIVDLAKEQKEYWDLMEQGEVDPDDVPEVDVAHDMDELLKTLSDEEFKEVSDVLENLDEEFEYWTANEYERREGVGERKKKAENANIYDESIKEALKPVTPVAIALKSAVESGDKKAIKQAQKDLTDALIASDLGLDYLSGQLAQAKLVKKKDELYKVKRATIKPLTDAIHAIESAKNIEDAPFADRLKHAIAETETEPTEAQKKAGNYKKGHLTFGGYDFTVETPKGVTRSGKDEQGKPWSVTMHDTYGYILGKIGVDGDHIDMFINDAADLDTFDGNVCVVDQVNPETGEFDEHKVMYGYPDEAAAITAYTKNYSPGWKGLGKVTSVPKATFDKWLESSDRKTKPFREYAMIQHEEAKKAKQANEVLPFDVPMNMDNLPFHRDVKEVKTSDMTEAQKVAYDAVSAMLKKAGIPVKVVSNEDMEKVAEAQDNLNLAMLLNQPEMRFKIKTPEEKQAAENAYNFAKELRPDKWKQYAVVDMSNPNKMPEYFEKQELARKERSYYNKLMWGNYKVFNLDKSFEDNVAGLTGSFPSEFDPYKIDAQTSKKNELKKQMKETEDAYNSTGQERNKYQIQLMKEYMDEHGLASENDIPDDVWSELDNKAHEKYQDKLDSLFAKYKDLDRQLKAIVQPGVRFLRAYHGSQASFDKFDHSFMGSGEGAQAYGWGTYVSEVEGIAKAYAKQNADRHSDTDAYNRAGMNYSEAKSSFEVATKKLNEYKSYVEYLKNDEEHYKKRLEDAKVKGDTEEVASLTSIISSTEHKIGDYNKWIDHFDTEAKEAKVKMDEAKKIFESFEKPRNLYTVEIPDDTGSNYIEWDEPLTNEQSGKIYHALYALPKEQLDKMAKRNRVFRDTLYDVLNNVDEEKAMPVLSKNNVLTQSTTYDSVPNTGGTAYSRLSDFLGGQKEASLFLKDAGFDGVKVIAQRNTGGNKRGKMNYVIFDENNAQIVDHTKFAQGKGVVYGYTDGKEIVLNQDHLNANTPIHEYQHLWRTAAKEMNPELIEHGDKLIMQTQLFADLKEDPNYKHLSDDEICDEAFARLTGEDGAVILEQMAKEAIKENPLDTAKELTIINRLKNWLKKFWYWTLDTFTKWKPEDIKKMTLEDIRNLVLRDLANGVDPRTVMNEKKEGAKLSKKEKDDATERIDKRIAELNRQEKEQSLKSENGNLAESHDNGYLPSKDNLDGVQSVAPSSAKIDKKFPTKTFYLRNLANFITSMGKNADITAGNFTKKLFEGMGMTPHGKDTQVSEYFKYQTDDGGKTTVRLSDHSGNALSIIKKGGRADKGYSIVVRVDSSPKTKFKANKYSNVAEYVYENPNADGLKDIARSVFNLIDTGEYLDLAGANEVHVSPRNNDADKTLAGVHNITEEKLRKALKLGGLANPSLAVIDTSKSAHDNFGEISFIAPSALVDKRTGKTGGTWITDAYTQRYPSVEREMSEKGRQKFNDWVDSLEYPAADKAEIKRQAEDALSNNNAPAWELMYLKEKGIDIKAYDSNVDYRWKEIIRDHPNAEDILNSMQTDPELNEKVTSLAKHAIIHPTWEKVSLEVRRKMYKETGVKASPINPQVRKQTKEIFERDYKPTLLDKDGNPKAEDVKKVVEDIVKEHNDTKKYDFYLSKVKASNYVNKNGLYDDYIRWQENKLDEFGTKNRIFRGYKNDGTRKYVPETLENVSKAMREDADGQTNGSEYTSFGSFIAKLASRVDSTSEMRANKDKLSSNEDKEKFYEKWESVYYDLAKSLYNDVFYGEQRLHDIVSQADPKKYAKKEYGITLSSSFMKKLDSLKNAVQNDLKSAYFETKFNRPVHLNEFVAAVVPSNLGEDVRKGLEESGLSLYDYDPEKEGDRNRAFNEAINSNNEIRFHRVTEPEELERLKPIVKQKLKKHPDSLMKAGTYFSGGGLVEEGLKGIIDPVVAVEYDRKISGVYRNNFGQHIVTADVRKVDPKELVKQIDGEVEYFHASPVCKNYSQAKTNGGEVELDKETAKSTADFIDAVKPRVVTIENVKGYKDSEAMKIITQALDKNGYTWDADVYNAADFGGYTNRERLIVRAVKDGELPEKPKKQPRKGGWLEAVEDILPTLKVKESGVAPWMDARLKADGIDWQKVEKPLYVMGSAYADGKIPHAYGNEILPTLRTKSGDVIIMPGGKVLRADGRVLARITGLGDDYLLPKTESLAHTIIGNGIPVQLTQGVIAPLLNKDDLSGRNVLARLGKSIFKNDWDADKQKKVSDQVVNTANKLGGAEATVYTSVDEVPDAYLSDVMNGATGWYDPTTHTVHVYLPNCADANEAERTVLHEKIGHEGIEVLLGGEDEVRKFANFVYNSVAASTRGKILEIANEYDPDWKKHDRMNVGTQEYIARLAEEGPKTAEDFSLWTKIKHYLIKVLKKLGVRVPGLLNDKDLRYYLMKAGKALHVWDDMPEAQQETMMKQASNAEIKDSLGEGAGKGKPRQKKGESMIQYMKRVQEWRKWKDAREDENDPEPPMFYDIDKDEAGKKEWEQLNKEWRDRHHLAGEEPTGMPIRMKGETDDAYMTRIHDYEKWKDAMKDEEDPIPDMFDFEKSKQEEVKRKYEDWLARHELLEQQQADLDLYEGKIYPAETNPKADDLEQQVMQDLAEVTSTDVSKEGAAKTVKHAVIHRRKNMEEASADDAIYINDVKNRIEKMADSGVFDKLLSDYKGKANRAEKLAEAIPYIIEAPRRLRDLAHDLNATGAFDKGHIHIQPEDVEAIQPYVADLIAETAKQHSELKDDKEVVVYDDPLAVGEVASKMAQAINNNHQGEEGFVPIDGSDIMSEHVLPLVMQQIVPDGIDYKNLSPEMKAALDSIRDWYNYTYDWLKDNRTLKEDTGYNADYVNHIWDKEKSDKQAYAMYVENRQRTKSPNEKPRTISTLMEGISVGLVPKTTDITKMMAYYSRSNIEAWANKTMLQELSGLNVIERNEDGEVVSTDPLLSSTAPFNLEQYKYFEIPGVGPVWVYNVSPKQVTVKNPITGKEMELYSEASAGDRFGVVFETYQSSPFWKAFDTLASSAKKLELGFSGFHAGALTEVYMVQNMVEFGPKKAMANFMKYIFVDTMKNHELPCFANPEDFQEAASHLVKFGATNDYAAADVQNMFDNMRDAMMKVQEKLKDGNGISGTVAVATMPLKVVTQLLSLINKGMDRALWDFLHDGLKLATYRMRADKTKERAKKKGWTEEELSRALDEDGQFVNDMFGGQHWDVLGASHRTLRYAGRVLLSPDWNASTTRHFLALTGYGSIWNEATFENFKQYYQRLWNKELMPEDEGRRGRQISALLCYGIGFMVFYEAFANGVNAAFRAMDEEKERKKAEEMRKTNPDYKSMYELAYGDEGMKWYDYLMRGNSLGQQSKIFLGRYADGTEMYIRHGKQFREVPEYLFNHKGELEFPGPMVQRMIGKANPMVRMTLDDINYLSDFQASHADQEIQRKYGKSIGLLYKDALYWAPFLIPSQENKEFKAVDFFFPSSKGFSPWKAQSYFKDFILSGDMEGVVMTYQSCQRNGIDPEAQIKAAIGSVKALESAEMNDGVTSLQEASQRFDAAKSITEKKKMRQKMKKFLSMSDYKAFTQKEALDMVQGYLNGEEDLKEMEKADSKYLMAAKAEDVTEDWRIQNAWNGTMEAYEEYQRLKDIDKVKANAFKNSKTNKRLFAARKAISAAKRKMNKAKKQMDGTNGAAKMVEIRKTRKELLEKLNGME